MRNFPRFQNLMFAIVASALLMACTPVEPNGSAPGKPSGPLHHPVLGCASGSPFAAKESLSLQIDVHELNGQFTAPVQNSNIKTVDQFKYYGPIQAKEFVKALVNREFERLGDHRTVHMQSKTFYNRLVVRALLRVIQDSKPQGKWSFGQNDSVELSAQDQFIRQTRLYLNIYDSTSISAPSNERLSEGSVHAPVVFCN